MRRDAAGSGGGFYSEWFFFSAKVDRRKADWMGKEGKTMNLVDRMKMLSLAMTDLSESVNVYAKAKEDTGYPFVGSVVHSSCSKKAITRRITQIRQDLIMLEKEM